MSGRDPASLLDQRVVIEQPQRSGDGMGGGSIAWQTLATLWAHVTPMRGQGRERARGEMIEALAGYRVTIRLRDDVDATMRLRWRTRVLVIHSLHERGEMLEILAYEEGA